METPQNMALDHLINLRFLVVGTQLALLWLICVIMILKKEELFVKFVNRMDDGLLTFPAVVIVNY